MRTPSLLIRGARVLDPARGFDGVADVGIRDGLIDLVGSASADGYDRVIEGTAVDGPFFWCSLDSSQPDYLTNPRLQIIFRKSDVRKKGKTRGWELMLSHDFVNGMSSKVYCASLVSLVEFLSVSIWVSLG